MKFKSLLSVFLALAFFSFTLAMTARLALQVAEELGSSNCSGAL